MDTVENRTKMIRSFLILFISYVCYLAEQARHLLQISTV